MEIPSKGIPIMLPLYLLIKYLPPKIISPLQVASDFVCSPPGAIQKIVWAFQVPVPLASILCISPGVIYSCHFFIMSSLGWENRFTAVKDIQKITAKNKINFFIGL